MSTALSASHSDAAFFRKRKAMVMLPLIVTPFIVALFPILGGGKGERYADQSTVDGKAGASGFNASVPVAKNGAISGRDVEGPGYGKAVVGQVLSNFTNTQQDSAARGLKAIPISSDKQASGHHRSSLAGATSSVGASPRQDIARNNSATAVSATGKTRTTKGYYYNPPKSGGYYAGSDQQIEAKLKTYEAAQQTPRLTTNQASGDAITTNRAQEGAQPASIQLSDNLTASRLAEPVDAENVFHTALTGSFRKEPSRAVLSGGNYGSKKVIAWMIPVVVHEDQAIHDGQQVKLRLLKEITADGVTIPANTILYAICQLSDDRLRLTVRSLQLGGQLIPLDLDVYDTDGSMGVNVPGLSQNSQVGGQLRSSAIQGVQVPGLGGLGNTVLNSARMGASQSARQATIRLQAGYNLFLKAQ